MKQKSIPREVEAIEVKKPDGISLYIIIPVSILILFGCSSLRHFLYQSNGYDLGIFDNGLYLIAIDKVPYVLFRGLHILGDHAAVILYAIAQLYKMTPNVHWLFAIQAISLAIGAIPTYKLALNAGLKESQAYAIALVYLLNPIVFNVNLFDFHPEVIALPAILWAVLAARLGHFWRFCLYILLILSCKAVLALTTAAMGFWLLLFEKKRWCGIFAIVTSIAWFLIATKIIIPMFSGSEVAGVGRYQFLGSSVAEIVRNLIFQPQIVLLHLFTLTNLKYLFFLVLPVIWGFSWQNLTPAIGAVPILFLNLLTDYDPQKALTNQYSVPILPFLILVVIATLASGKVWLKTNREIILWSLWSFAILSQFFYFEPVYFDTLDTWQATKTAIAQIQNKDRVLTTNLIAPHLTHREGINLVANNTQLSDLTLSDFVLLNRRHPGFDNLTKNEEILAQMKQLPEFDLKFQQDGVFLFVKRKPN
jgi:uncharacterized membrane protein